MDQPLRLLVVDDNEVDREQVRRLLTQYQVKEAATTKEARERLGEERPDLVLLDNRLPDADGVDVLPVFVEAQIPVVMLTEVGAPEVIVEAMQRGAMDYLVKRTITRETLEHAIRNAIEKSQLRRRVDAQQRALAHQASVLRERNKEIRALASALTMAEQGERRRVASLLHDDLQQLLLGVKLNLRPVRVWADEHAPEGLRERLHEVDDLLARALTATRTLAIELTPPVLDREDLDIALRWLADHLGRTYGIALDVETMEECPVPSPELRVLLIQLVRELVLNVVKHAGVEYARITLGQNDGTYAITVADDGRGFDPGVIDYVGDGQGAGFGLYSIKKRLELLGGRLTVESAEGQGTRATIFAPVETWDGEAA
ncbi:MAG TPA: response regulator [Rubricoccaceae bacterium]|nr:response regulator [Rubricoccaceae bacterium]